MVRIVDARRGHRTLLTLAATVALVGAAVAPAQAHGGHGHPAPSPTRVASGLDNPRQLSFGTAGDLYVAEAGAGGSGPCMTGPEGGEVCFGTTGAVTRLTRKGAQSRVLTGLPSIAGPDGSQAIGPADVQWLGGKAFAVVVGLGANPAVRAGLPAAGAKMATIQLARRGSNATHTWVDLGDYEATANPIHDPDSNPSSIVRNGSGFLVTDSGGNDLVAVSRTGRLSTAAVFDDQLATAPPFLGLPPGTKVPAQAVPTAVVRGPDGAFYVSQLTGFPFEPGLANIYRVVPGHAPTVYASGLTNVTSLAFGDHGRLYAVQIADGGLLGDPIGSVRRVTPGGSVHAVVAGGLFAPYGMAIRGHDAYVSTCSVCAGGGEVWRISL
jgi:hypothetical protein